MGFGLQKPADEPGKAWPAIVIGLFVAFGGVLFGYDVRIWDLQGGTMGANGGRRVRYRAY